MKSKDLKKLTKNTFTWNKIFLSFDRLEWKENLRDK